MGSFRIREMNLFCWGCGTRTLKLLKLPLEDIPLICSIKEVRKCWIFFWKRVKTLEKTGTPVKASSAPILVVLSSDFLQFVCLKYTVHSRCVTFHDHSLNYEKNCSLHLCVGAAIKLWNTKWCRKFDIDFTNNNIAENTEGAALLLQLFTNLQLFATLLSVASSENIGYRTLNASLLLRCLL